MTPTPRGRSRRRFLRGSLALAGFGLLAGCGTAPPWGQQPAKTRRIGFLSGGRADTANGQATAESFRHGLRERGRVDGQDVAIEFRYWGDAPDRAAELAAELVALPAEVIVAVGSRDAHAARQATAATPIVMVGITDPVGQGLAASLARPGGNVTGQSSGAVELTGKRLELLKEVAPGLSRVAIFWEPSNPAHIPQWEAVRAACPALGLAPIPLTVDTPESIAGAFRAADGQAGAMLAMSSGVMTQNRATLATLARQFRLPSMYMDRAYVEAGGLSAYGANLSELTRTAAAFGDKILNGTAPADLPVEQPTRLDCIVNAQTAQALGLAIPPSVLAQATEVIQ